MNKTAFIIFFVCVCFGALAQNYQINWQQCFGGTEQDEPYDIIEIPGGYFILGTTESSDGDVSFNHGISDGWLIKTDDGGNIIWEKTYGGSSGDNFVRIFPAENGNFYIMGASRSSDGDISFDPYPDSWDHWILKINSGGDIIWDKIVGGNAGEVLWTGDITEDGGIVTVGWTNSNDGDISVYFGGQDTWITKISSEGELEWDFTLGTDWIDVGQAIIQTSDGGYLVGGSSMLGEGGNITCEPHSSLADAILTKLDADRNIEWQRCYGGSENDGATALLEVNDGYIMGGYAGSNDGDISGWHGEDDIWIVKIDYWGNIVWQNPLGGTRSEFTSSIFELEDGSILIPGYSQSHDGDVSGNHSISEYDYDIWLAKLNAEGQIISQQCFGGEGSEIVDFGLVRKDDYNFVIAGQTDYGPSYDVACTPHGGNYDKDFWVFEIQDTTTGIENRVVEKDKLKVYPNPASKYVVFEFWDNQISNSFSKSDINIFNSFGQKVVCPTIYSSGNKLIWDSHLLEPGIYMYSFTVNSIIITGKIIIQK